MSKIDQVALYVGLSVIWVSAVIVSLIAIIAFWHLVVAPVQRVIATVYFVHMNPEIRSKEFEGVGLAGLAWQTSKNGLFRLMVDSYGDGRVGEITYGYRVNWFGLMKYWINK